jgi:hypothetical protein
VSANEVGSSIGSRWVKIVAGTRRPPEVALDTFDEVVAALDRPASGDEDVHGHERAAVRAAGAQGVELHVVAGVADGSPDVRHEVAAVGFQRQRSVLAAGGHEDTRDAEVHSEATTDTATPIPTSLSGFGSMRRPTAETPIVTAASRMRAPSTPAES